MLVSEEGGGDKLNSLSPLILCFLCSGWLLLLHVVSYSLLSSLRTLSYPLIVVPITKYGVVFDHAGFSLGEYEPLPPRHLEVSCAPELLLEGVAPEGIVLADCLEASAHEAQTDCCARRQKRKHMLEDLRRQCEDVRYGLGRIPRLS